MHRLDMRKIAERVLQIDEDFHAKMIENLQSSRESLGRTFDSYRAKGEECPSHLEDEAADENGFLTGATEIVLVSLYHSTERSLKKFLVRAKPAARRSKVDFLYLTSELGLGGLPGYDNVDLLRLLANSWKHDPFAPDRKIFDKLGIPEKPSGKWADPAGLLDNDRIAGGIAARIGVSTSDAGCVNIATGFSKVCYAFLREVLARTPFPP